MLSISFLIKPSDCNSKGESPIYCRFFVNSKKKEISTGIRVPADWWNVEAKRIMVPKKASPADKQLIKEYNETIRVLEGRVRAAYNKLLDRGKEVSALMLKEELTDRNRHKTLVDAFEMLRKKAKASGRTSVHLHINRYEKHFREFCKKHYHSENLLLSELYDRRDLSYEYEAWAIQTKGWKSTYARKSFSYVKQAINMAYEMGWIEKVPKYHQIKARKEDISPKDVLNTVEVKRLQETDFQNESLRRVADIFLFQCYTSLAYVDVKNLKWADLKQDLAGNWCIPKPRQKSGQEFVIPLVAAAWELIEKYREDAHRKAYYPDYIFPVKSNGKMNAYLKIIANFCGIEKHLSTHVARYTCNQLLYEAGVSDEIRKQILGHSTVKMTAHYTKVNSEVLSKAMEKLDF